MTSSSLPKSTFTTPCREYRLPFRFTFEFPNISAIILDLALRCTCLAIFKSVTAFFIKIGIFWPFYSARLSCVESRERQLNHET